MGAKVEIHLFVKRCVGRQNKGGRSPDLVLRESNSVRRAKPASDLHGTKTEFLREPESCEPILREWIIRNLPCWSRLPLLPDQQETRAILALPIRQFSAAVGADDLWQGFILVEHSHDSPISVIALARQV
jgi:hypothetical protein